MKKYSLIIIASLFVLCSCSIFVQDEQETYFESEQELQKLSVSDHKFQWQEDVKDLVFFIDFDHDGTFYKGGIFADVVQINKKNLVEGCFGKGYHFGGKEKHFLTIPLFKIPFSPETGTITLWVKTDEADIKNAKGNHCFVGVGSRWWKPEWKISSKYFMAGDCSKEKYKKGLIHNSNKLNAVLKDGKWHHLSLTWNQKELTGYLDGKTIGRTKIAPANNLNGLSLMIGTVPTPPSRISANAVLDEVAIYSRCLSGNEIQQLKDRKKSLSVLLPKTLLQGPSRTLFSRNEENAEITLKPVKLNKSENEINVTGIFPADFAYLKEENNSEKFSLRPCRLIPGKYPVTVALTDGDNVFPGKFDIEIVQAPVHSNFIMRNWGGATPDLKSLGFNAASAGSVQSVYDLTKQNLFSDLMIYTDRKCFHPMSPENIEKSRLQVIKTAYNTRNYPQIVSCLINTELNCKNVPYDRQWFIDWLKKDTGLNIDDPCVKQGPKVYKPKVKNGIVPNNDPAYRFHQWWMEKGYGWGGLDAIIRQTMESVGLKTMYCTDRYQSEEAVKKMSLVSDWKYPNTIEGLIVKWSWLRSRAILAGRGLFPTPGLVYWDDGNATRVKVNGKKPVLCYSPDFLRQTLWITLSEPVWGIAFYALSHRQKDYYDKNCNNVLKEFLAVAPAIGNMLKDVPRRQNDVALLETSSWAALDSEVYKWLSYWNMRFFSRALARARVDFDWITEEHVKAGWLKKYKYVILPFGKYLPEYIYNALYEFSRNGGQVIADETLVADIPGVKKLPYRVNTKWSAGWQQGAKAATDWSKEYHASHKSDITVSSPEENWLVVREIDGIRYLFVINDKFVPGKFAEQFKVKFNVGGKPQLIRDKGLTQVVDITADGLQNSTVYDILYHQKVKNRYENGKLKWRTQLPPGGAKLYVIYPEPIKEVQFAVPDSANLGEKIDIGISILTESGNIHGRQLVEIEVYDPDNKKLDIDSFHQIKNGKCNISFWFPRNAVPGNWKVNLKEWTTGKSLSKVVKVKK